MDFCGLHALAIATQLQHGKNSELCRLNLNYKMMRKHIVSCLESRKVILFSEIEEWPDSKEYGKQRLCVHGQANHTIETLSFGQ